MSGWIKIEKDLKDDPRILRMASRLRHADVTLASRSVPMVIGALVTLWWYADTHIGDDDVLAIGADEVDQLVGLPGFCALMPRDWLEIIDAEHVKLIDYTVHNGTLAKNRALQQKRQERHRENTPESRPRHADVTPDALPDKTRQDQTRQDQEKTPSASATPRNGKPRKLSHEADPEWLLDLKRVYPDRCGDPAWQKAVRAGNARLQEGYSTLEFIEGARRYSSYCEAMEITGTQYVKQASGFLGPAKLFLLPWALPPSKAQVRQDKNLDATQIWLREQEAKDAAH
jgi:hypothetical protein